jgi:hypothetical protein
MKTSRLLFSAFRVTGLLNAAVVPFIVSVLGIQISRQPIMLLIEFIYAATAIFLLWAPHSEKNIEGPFGTLVRYVLMATLMYIECMLSRQYLDGEIDNWVLGIMIPLNAATIALLISCNWIRRNVPGFVHLRIREY